MKKLLFILVLCVGFQISAQDQSNWLTDNEVALKQSETQNKPVLVFVTDNQKTDASVTLKKMFFDTDSYKKCTSKVILLKLNISDKNSSNARLGIHYTKQNSAPGLSLIDKRGKTIIDPLVDMTSESIMVFKTLLHDKL